MSVIPVAGFFVGVGQLLVGILALRAHPKVERGRTSGLASNRGALNALLVAATCTTAAAVALGRVQDSNENYHKAVRAEQFARRLPDGTILSPLITNVLIVVGLAVAVGAFVFAQRAWRAWSNTPAQAHGVALAAISAVVAGALAVNLVAAFSRT
jgi:amino acid transporter